MPAHLDIMFAQSTRNNRQLFFALRVLDPKQIIRQELAKAPVCFDDAVDRGGAASEAPVINPLLDGNMGPGLKLQIAFSGVCAVVLPEGALYIDGMRIVPFNEIAVVAVHRPDKIGQRCHDATRQAATEAAGRLCQLYGQVAQGRAEVRALREHKWLQQADALAPVLFGCYFGRSIVRFSIAHKNIYNI